MHDTGAGERKVRGRTAAAADAEGLPATTHRRTAEIIDAAAHVFAQKGFHGATTQDIADRLGIKQASLYYYFKSKEAALETVCLKGAEGFYETARRIERGPGSASDRLQALVRAHLLPLVDRADYMRVFLNERQHLPRESRRRIGRWAKGLEQIFERIIAEGIAAGELRPGADPRLATLAILGMANAVPAWYAGEGAGVERIADELCALLIGGLGKG